MWKLDLAGYDLSGSRCVGRLQLCLLEATLDWQFLCVQGGNPSLEGTLLDCESMLWTSGALNTENPVPLAMSLLSHFQVSNFEECALLTSDTCCAAIVQARSRNGSC